jgi:starch synthase
MRVLFVTSEIYPLVKTGGLADVCGALPPALAAHGIDVRCLVPGYPAVLTQLHHARGVAELHDLFGGGGTLIQGQLDNGTTVLAIDAPHLFDRLGNPYLGPDRLDWPDNDLRFAALGWIGTHLARGDFDAWPADVLHAHDWQAGLAPAYLALQGGRRPATVTTIHNIAYQGLFPPERLELLRLPPESLAVEGVEYYGKMGFLKAGLYYADRITTVSATYAREIQRPEQGCGLEGLLRSRAADLTGILNGIDETVWNPATDQHLASCYDVSEPAGKAANKIELQERYGLVPTPNRPLFAVISRLTPQKGLDLLVAAVPGLVAAGAQLALLGSGDADLEEGFRRAAAEHPRQIGVVIGYDEPLSHLIQGGADAIVVPSRAEPCGLTQLYGLRYGTLPVVAKVGGLADSVIDANEAALTDGVATGFVFAPVTADALIEALRRAAELFAQRERWRMVQRRAMSREVGWHASAARYAAVYRDLVTGQRARAAR